MFPTESHNASRSSSAQKANFLCKLSPITLVRLTPYFRLPIFCPTVQLFSSPHVRKLNALNVTYLGHEPWAWGMHRSRRCFHSFRTPRCNRPGDNMINRLGVIFLLVGASAASPAFAGDSATMKCNTNQDRIWVYDSLNSFDVSAKLKCGETVEITARVKGYVKIRAANGTEGYVQESTFPDLPPFVDPNDSQSNVSIAKRIAPRAATHPAAAASTSADKVSTPAPVATAAPASAVTVASAPTPGSATAPVATPAPAPALTVASAPASATPPVSVVRTAAVA